MTSPILSDTRNEIASDVEVLSPDREVGRARISARSSSIAFHFANAESRTRVPDDSVRIGIKSTSIPVEQVQF